MEQQARHAPGMPRPLRGRVALVTGGGRGLGEEVPVVVLGSQREQEKGRLLAREAASPGVHDLTGQTSGVEYAAALQRAALVVTSHSSAMHIADAFRRPLVVLFSGTDLPEQWRPWNSPVVLLGRRTRCAPCYLLDCPTSKPCLDVPVWEVVEAALGLLERGQPGTEGTLGVLRDRFEVLGPGPRRLPAIYLEHDPPREHPTDTRHVVDDPQVLLCTSPPSTLPCWTAGAPPPWSSRTGVPEPVGVRYTGELCRASSSSITWPAAGAGRAWTSTSR